MRLWPRGWPRRFGGRLWWNLAVVPAAFALPWALDAIEAARTAANDLGVDADAANVAAAQSVLILTGVTLLTTIVVVLLSEALLPALRAPWAPRVLLLVLAVAFALVLPLVAGRATYPTPVLLAVHGAIALLWAVPPARGARGGGGGGGGGSRAPDAPRPEEDPRDGVREPERELVLR